MALKPLAWNGLAGVRRAVLTAALCAAAAGCDGGLDIRIGTPGKDAQVPDAAVTVTGVTAGPVVFVTVNDGAASSADGFGTWSASVRLAPGPNTITAVAYDAAGHTRRSAITVTRVVPFSVAGQAMAFSAVRDSARAPEPAGGYALDIQGTLAEWTVAGPPWVEFSPGSSGRGPARVTVTARAAGLDVGTVTGDVTVTDARTPEPRSFLVSLDVRPPGLVVSPAALSFSIDASTPAWGYSRALMLSDDVEGTGSVAWTVQSVSAPWLRVSPSSGVTDPAAQVTVSVDRPSLASAPSGANAAAITFAWQDDRGIGRTTVVPVALDLELPRPWVDFVAPHVGVEGRSGALVLRGRSFNAFGSTVTAVVGATELAGQVTQGDTQLTITSPALPAGRYPVGIKGAPGSLRTNAELVVLPAPGYSYAAIPASGPQPLIWDAERQALYSIGGQSLERRRYSGGAWVTDPSYILSQLTDADLSPDGRSLVALSAQAVYDIDLDAPSWSAVLRATNPYSSCSTYLTQLAVANNGTVFITSSQGSAFCREYTPSFLYSMLDHSMVANPYPNGWFYRGGLGGSADGTRIYIGNNSFDPAPGMAIFDSLANTLTPNGPDYWTYGLSISSDASRVIAENNMVLNRALVSTGNLGSGGGSALASRDSSKAFVYRDDGGQPRLVIFDLNGPLQAGAVYPVLRTINLADGANASAGSSVTMTSTHDDSVVFISGNSKLLVVPVN